MTNHIKIYGVKPRIQYVADGNLKTYEFPFAIFKTSDIDVYFNDKLQEKMTYSISTLPDTEGGCVIFETAPQNETVITIMRNLSIERTSDFQEGGTLRAKVLNDEFDYQIACQQQIADNLNRSMVLPPYATDTDVDLTLPTPSAGRAIVWNKDGTNLENSTVKVNELESTLKEYKESADAFATIATNQANIATTNAQTATTQAQVATAQATLATNQAELATQKVIEVSNALSTKANISMDNLTSNGKKTCLKLSFPSTSYIEITTPAIGTEGSYTAPANGYMVGDFNVSSTKCYYLLNKSAGYLGSCSYAGNSGTYRHRLFCPIQKGQVCVYQIETGSYGYLRFYYAQGEI